MRSCGKIFYIGISQIVLNENLMAIFFNLTNREELQRNLRIINNVLMGCEAVFPYWKEEPLLSEPYVSCFGDFSPNIGNKFEINMPDRTNVRQFVVRLMTSLQEMILQSVEDDIKSLILVAYVSIVIYLRAS